MAIINQRGISTTKTTLTIYRSARNTRCGGHKVDGTPPLQPKRLGQISSFFGERPLMGIY